MSYARVITSSGNHTLLSEEGFIAYVYGYGNNESFGYATGAGLSNLSLSVDIRNQDRLVVPVDSLCLNDVYRFTPFSSFSFDEFIYDFDDGTQIRRNDNSTVTHQYSDPGTYIFRLTGLDDQENCEGGSETTEVRVIKVINPALEIRGPRSVCPNTSGVTYFVEDNRFYENRWFVEGGTLVSQSRDSMVVDWGETNSNAAVKLLAENRYACTGDTVIFPVRINIQLEPEAPFGPDSLCSSDIRNVPYETYFTNGSIYDWKVENGQITSGQGTHQVHVDWFSPGTGKIWFDQMAQTDTICDGTSDTLFVFIQRDPSPIADLLTEKVTYQVDETVRLTVNADTLLQMYNLYINESLYEDSIPLMQDRELQFNCPEVYQLSVEVFDTVGICSTIATGSNSISVLQPELEIIRVSHDPQIDSTLRISWISRFTDFMDEPVELQWLSGNWEQVSSGTAGEYIHSHLSTGNTTFLYRASSSLACPESVTSEVHNSMVLQIEQPDPDVAVLSWNAYAGWKNGVQNYEVQLSVDGGEWRSLASVHDTGFTFENDTMGFDYCFRILANEKLGNRSDSYSNTSCALFIPPLYPYNIITPNGDGKNDEFVIESVEFYPNSRLVIVNRWGRVVMEKTGYQNDWQGTEGQSELPSGVYFYVLELNEPRVDEKQINGLISILR
jgi:gliding motility-associated-like protein